MQQRKRLFFTSHHQWKQLWVLKNITAWMCGWVETRDIVVPLRWSMLCGTPHCHIILWTREEMTGQHQQGNLLCKGTSCTMPGTLMASVPSGPKIAKRTRRQNSFCSVQGIDFKYTVNTLTDSKSYPQFCLLTFKMIDNLSGFVQWHRKINGTTSLHFFV